MSRNGAVQRLARRVQAMPEPAQPQLPEPESEPQELAREIVRAFSEEWERFRRAREKERESERPDPSQPPPDWLVEALLKKSPEDVHFYDLERLARVDPAHLQARWDEVRAAARRDLGNGWLAGRALEFQGGSAWERACFLAVREQLRRSWPPSHDGEAMLIDQMAQYEMVRQKWVGILAMMSREPRTIVTLDHPYSNSDKSRAMTAAGATLEAVRMVERLQRLYQNALRTLLSLRRGKAPVIVRQAAQVNVSAGPQLNVQAAPPSDSLEGAQPAAV